MSLKRSILVMTAIASFMVLTYGRAAAQSETPKFEIGVHFTNMRFSEFDDNMPGAGLRGTVNLTRRVSVEGEINFFPTGVVYNASRSQLQGLFGVKYGVRPGKYGVFAKARPGFVFFDKAVAPTTPTACPAIFPGFYACDIGNHTRFALDVGGVFEVYPSRRTALRFDLGDTIIRHGGGPYTRPNGRAASGDSFINHNLQFSIGAGLRF